MEYFCLVNFRHSNPDDCDGGTWGHITVWGSAEIYSDFLLHDQPNVHFLPCQPLDCSRLPY